MIKKISPWAGIIGTIVFTLTFLLNGLLRPLYDPMKMYVSELSIRPQGWIQNINFMFLGGCLFVFAHGIPKYFTEGKAAHSGSILLKIIAICYFFSGLFVTDSASMFDNQQSIHGIIHGVLGAVVFSLSPACCFVFWRHFLIDKDFKYMNTWTFIAGIIMVITVVLMKIGQLQPGILHEWAGVIQRCSLMTFYTWIVTFAFGLKKLQT